MTEAIIERVQVALTGRYRISSEIGRGGMARVFLGHDQVHDRPVAIKVLSEEIGAVLGSARFEREISIAARLLHPHIVPLLDSGSADGLLYYVMPVIDGETLSQRLKRERQLPADVAVNIACDVAAALTYAHERGVVHRDVKPANILLQGSSALLTDFGIARALATMDTEDLTDSGIVPGTPMYMSPEQSGGAAVDGRSDLYSLGCVLHEMLAGDPPFRAPTINGLIAQHALAPPPSIEIVRPAVSPTLAIATRRALAKAPADRFATGTDFVAALRAAPAAAAAAPLPARSSPRTIASPVLIVGLVATLAAGLFAMRPRDPDLDDNRVVVFPLATTNTSLVRAGVGWDVALAIGAALEHTEPLRWLDGWTYLPEELRADPNLVSQNVQRRVSASRGARYFIDGVIRFEGDRPTIVLRLYDVDSDSLVAQQTVTGASNAVLATVGMDAVTSLLPRLIAPDRVVDLAPLRDRAPGAIALSIQGDRAYRRSRFADALAFYSRAVEADSQLAFAAVKGAQAASWENKYGDAAKLITVAMTHQKFLPARYQHLAAGWRHFLGGDADSAVRELRLAGASEAGWVEASTAMGEVYYHLFPAGANSDSLADIEFRRALTADSLFVPALFHATEIAVRRGRTQDARRFVIRIASANPDKQWTLESKTMLECATTRPGNFDWDAIANDDPGVALLTARSLAMAGSSPGCAEPGFRAVLRSAKGVASHWGALMGLQAVLLAQGKYDSARVLLDSAKNAGSRGVYLLYVMDDLAGAPLREQASGTEQLTRKAGEDYARAQPATRMLLGVWDAVRGDTVRAAAVVRALRADSSPAWVGDAIDAQLNVVRGDTAGAIALLSRLIDGSRGRALMWDITGPLAPERMLLARLFYARRDFVAAERVAAAFDHQEPVVFLPFLPRSLALRLRAAEARGAGAVAAGYRRRLEALGWRGAQLEQLLAEIPTLRN